MKLAQKIIGKLENIHPLYIFTVLFLLTLIVYGVSLSNGFVWDDEEQIVNNAIIQNLHNIPYLFTASTFNTGGAGGLSGWYYKPLMPFVFSIIFWMFGNNAFGFHLFDIFLHFINGVLIFILFRSLAHHINLDHIFMGTLGVYGNFRKTHVFLKFPPGPPYLTKEKSPLNPPQTQEVPK